MFTMTMNNFPTPTNMLARVFAQMYSHPKVKLRRNPYQAEVQKLSPETAIYAYAFLSK